MILRTVFTVLVMRFLRRLKNNCTVNRIIFSYRLLSDSLRCIVGESSAHRSKLVFNVLIYIFDSDGKILINTNTLESQNSIHMTRHPPPDLVPSGWSPVAAPPFLFLPSFPSRPAAGARLTLRLFSSCKSSCTHHQMALFLVWWRYFAHFLIIVLINIQ